MLEDNILAIRGLHGRVIFRENQRPLFRSTL